MAPDNWILFLPILSLCALVIVSRYREWLQNEDTDGYRYMLIGLSVFALTNLAPLYQSAGAFERISFLNDPLFFALVTWIAVLTGLIFLASGVSSFLPLAREHRRYNRTVISRLELLKETEQLIGVETRPEAILEGIVNHVATTYPLRAGSAFVFSDTNGRLEQTSANTDIPISPGLIESISIEIPRFLHEPRTYLRKLIVSSHQISAHDIPSIVIPVASGNKLYGALLFWFERGYTADDSSRMNLKLAAEIAGRSIDASDHRKRATCRLNYCHLASAITQMFAPGASVKETFRSIAHVLCHVLGAETISVVLRSNDGRWHRLSMGVADTVLHEKNVRHQNISVVARQAYAEGTPIYHRVCHSADMIRSGHSMGEGSLLALPIIRSGKGVGVLSLMSSKQSTFDEFNLTSLVQTVTTIGELNWYLNRETTRGLAQRRQQLVRAYLRDVYSQLSAQEILEDLARVASIGVENDIVRVSTFDRQRRFLNSRALAIKTSGGRIAPERAALILELLPVHRMLLDGRRMIVLGEHQGDLAMSREEMSHMFGESVVSAALIPIAHEGEVVGVISLARSKSSSAVEFDEYDTSYLEMIAATASLAIRQASLDRNIRRSRLHPSPQPEMRSRIKSSLSGIVGSVEMIRSRGEDQDEVTTKYLEIIDRSARRLGETVEHTTN